MNVMVIERSEEVSLHLHRNFSALKFGQELRLIAVKSLREGYEIVKSSKVDLVILNINLCAWSSATMLRRIQQSCFEVIFLVKKANETNAILVENKMNCLSLPIERNALEELMTSVIAKMTIGTFKNPTQLETDTKVTSRILIKEGKGVRVVEVNDIVHCKADNNYTEIYLNNGSRIVSAKTLKSYETLLKEQAFVRIHQSHLVDLKRVTKIIKDNGYFVQLDNEQRLPLSRRRRAQLLKQMGIN